MRHVQVGELRIAIIEDGPTDGRPVVMVHGFPDGPWTFDHMAAAFADAGYRVIRPYLRGYRPTSIPAGRVVALPDLVADLDGLAHALDLRDPILVGHDWGAVIGWASTTRARTPWSAFVALAIPPPAVQARAMRSPTQALYRSGYMWWMLVPGVQRFMPRLATRLYRKWSPGWQVPAGHLEQVRQKLSDPDVARAAAGYYRWMILAALTGRHPRARRATPVIPVMYLHGRDDRCFTSATAGTATAYLPPGSVQIVQDAGHFLHLQRPHTVTAAALDFAEHCHRDPQS